MKFSCGGGLVSENEYELANVLGTKAVRESSNFREEENVCAGARLW